MLALAPRGDDRAPGAEQSAASLSAAALLGCLVIVARYRGIHLSAAQLIRDHQLGRDEPSPDRLIEIARACGLRTLITRMSFDSLTRLGEALPAIVLLKNGGAMVLVGAGPSARPPTVSLRDPHAAEDALLVLDEVRFAEGSTGQVILLKGDHRLRDEEQPFGVAQIFGLVLRDRGMLREMIISAFLMAVLALAPIFFWRLLLDRVLFYESIDTEIVLCTAFAVLVVFEIAFGWLRRKLVHHLSRRVDAKLSTDIFNKVLKLPIDFFERTPTGEITRDISEIWRIRNFLGGQALGAMLELAGDPGDPADPVLLQRALDRGRARHLRTDPALALHHAADHQTQSGRRLCRRGGEKRLSGRDRARHARGQVARPRRPPPPAMGHPCRPSGGSAVSARASGQPRANRHAAARAADDQRRVRARRLSRNFDPKPGLCRRPRRVHHADDAVGAAADAAWTAAAGI